MYLGSSHICSLDAGYEAGGKGIIVRDIVDAAKKSISDPTKEKLLPADEDLQGSAGREIILALPCGSSCLCVNA